MLEAFTHENLRFLSQVPLLIPHMTIVDTEVAGYKVRPSNPPLLQMCVLANKHPGIAGNPE